MHRYSDVRTCLGTLVHQSCLLPLCEHVSHCFNPPHHYCPLAAYREPRWHSREVRLWCCSICYCTYPTSFGEAAAQWHPSSCLVPTCGFSRPLCVQRTCDLHLLLNNHPRCSYSFELIHRCGAFSFENPSDTVHCVEPCR